MRQTVKYRATSFLIFLVVSVTAMFIECDVYFPDNIKIFSGEQIDVREGSPYSVSVASTGGIEATGDYEATVKLFGLIPVKNVEVNVTPSTEVLPGGKTVGIKLFTKGLMCVGTEKLKGENKEQVNIAENADIKNADMILAANGVELHTVEQFGEIVSGSGGKSISLTIERGGEKFEKTLVPVKTQEGYKLGIWVRDSTAGIGTVTFTDPKTNRYGALGHPITDIDTGALMPVQQGSISDAKIIDVKKGKRGEPGELCGVFDPAGSDRGVILKNTSAGIYGAVESGYSAGAKKPVPVASKSAVHTGKAEIYANIEENKVEKFEVEIVKIMKHAQDDKNMIIRVTDQRLIDKTGGIVQGMSGSPILQDGKIIGAVTHVFVNDPTRGYGIFIESMLSTLSEINE